MIMHVLYSVQYVQFKDMNIVIVDLFKLLGNIVGFGNETVVENWFKQLIVAYK